MRFPFRGFTTALLFLLALPGPVLAQAGTRDPSLTPRLQRALGAGDAAEVERLLVAGAPITGDEIFIALTSGPEMVRLLVDHGADPDAPNTYMGMSSLAFFSGAGDVDNVRLLLSVGADPNRASGEAGVTPLYMAAAQNRTEVARILLDAGADPGAKTASGESAMDWAAAVGLLGGDTRMAEILGQGSPEEEELLERLKGGMDVDGTHQEGAMTLSEDQATYPAGTFTGPCVARRNPRFDPAHPTPGTTGSGGYRETHVSFVGGMKVGMITPPECEPLDLAPAQYEVTVLGGDVTWVWSCREDSGEGCPIVVKKEAFEAADSRFQVGVVPAAPRAEEEPDDDCRVESLTITSPDPDYQVSFDDSPRGFLKLTAQAEALPSSCDQPLDWSIESLGSVSAKVEPGGDAGENGVTFTYYGLPDRNEDFGPTRITVRAGGRQDTLSVEIFFDPTSVNHPGRDSAPNWFHYWGQTLAGGGQTVKYTPERISETEEGVSVQGQYDYAEDIVYLTDRAFGSSCAPRTPSYGGGESKGIDCFAELVRHESQHKKDRHAWWGAFNPKAAKDQNLPEYMAEYDADADLVPNRVEEELSDSRGCNWMWRWSCAGRPEGKIDLEMNAYGAGWSWIRGGADREDWSWCGKQWQDAQVCPGKKIW